VYVQFGLVYICFLGVAALSIKRMEVLKSLAVEAPTKIVMLVIDGLGGLPDKDGMTELERAVTPNLDKMALEGETGLLEMVDVGLTPGSGPGHLALFGYDPLEFPVGRGILEALGTGATVSKGDVCARGNFATWGQRDVIVDRRAGRIETEKSRELVRRLSEAITEIEGVKINYYPGMEHRFSLVFSGEGLCDCVSDADPQREGSPMKWAEAISPEGAKMAYIANKFIQEARKVLRDEPKANGCLLRGFSGVPDIPHLSELYKIKPLALAAYPMYKGLASLVGMDVLDDIEGSPAKLIEELQARWDAYDFFYVHVKHTDSRGEDGDVAGKVKVIEEVDKVIPSLMELSPDVLVVTGDHSTPAKMKGHSWHPSPIALLSSYVRPDGSSNFGERACARGSLGIIPAWKLMGLLLAHGRRLKKFGA